MTVVCSLYDFYVTVMSFCCEYDINVTIMSVVNMISMVYIDCLL